MMVFVFQCFWILRGPWKTVKKNWRFFSLVFWPRPFYTDTNFFTHLRHIYLKTNYKLYTYFLLKRNILIKIGKKITLLVSTRFAALHNLEKTPHSKNQNKHNGQLIKVLKQAAPLSGAAIFLGPMYWREFDFFF